jgi:hypothetical protein
MVLQILPFTVIGLLSSGLGAWIWPPPTSAGATLLRTLLLLLSFLGLLALKRTANWNVVILVLFGFLVGSFAGLIPSGKGNLQWWYSLGLASSIIIASYFASRIIRRRLSEIGMGLWLLTWIYVLGWAGLFLLDLDPVFQVVWASFGLILFVGMSIVWFSNSKPALDRFPGSALGIDLFLITLNLIIASSFLLHTIR